MAEIICIPQPDVYAATVHVVRHVRNERGASVLCGLDVLGSQRVLAVLGSERARSTKGRVWRGVIMTP